MFCQECGNRLEEGDRFCTACGKKVEIPESVVKPVVPEEPKAPVKDETPVRVEAPVREEAPVRVEAPVKEEAPVRVETPVRREVPDTSGKKGFPVWIFALLAGIIIALAAVFVFFFFINKPSVELNKYISVSFEGYDTEGKAEVSFDKERFRKDYGKKLPDSFLYSCVDGSLDRVTGLSNGDTVKYIWDCDDSTAKKKYKHKLKYEDMMFKVSGLQEKEDDQITMAEEPEPEDNEAQPEERGDISEAEEPEYPYEEDIGIAEEPEDPYEEEQEEDPREERERTGMIFPNSSEELVDKEAVEELTDEELRYAINEIYARNGYIFRDEKLRAYYNGFDWYEERIKADSFSAELFNPIERKNVELMQKERDSRR